MNVPNNGIRIVKATYIEIMSSFPVCFCSDGHRQQQQNNSDTVQSTKNKPVAIYECAK